MPVSFTEAERIRFYGFDFDHMKVQDIGRVDPLPESFRLDRETGRPPEGTEYLHRAEYGSQVEDAAGNRFRVMGPGSVQGSVTPRNRYRQMFYADCEEILRPLGNLRT